MCAMNITLWNKRKTVVSLARSLGVDSIGPLFLRRHGLLTLIMCYVAKFGSLFLRALHLWWVGDSACRIGTTGDDALSVLAQ